MATYTLRVETSLPYDAALTSTREALAAQGFGIISEIDLAATLKAKLDVDLPPTVILGACRPQLAYEAMQKDPAIATLLPCNVSVRSTPSGTTVIEAVDPSAMMGLADGGGFDAVAADARLRLVAALAALSQES